MQSKITPARETLAQDAKAQRRKEGRMKEFLFFFASLRLRVLSEPCERALCLIAYKEWRV
jgi:hypothetical protein